MDFNGVSVNELGSGRGPVATYAYGDGGTHYFSIWSAPARYFHPSGVEQAIGVVHRLAADQRQRGLL